MQVAVIREAAPERRVALSPGVVSELLERGHSVAVERGAGDQSSFTDDTFRTAGADIVDDPLSGAELVLVVGPPTPEQVTRVPVGATLIGFLDPFAAVDTV